MFTLTRQFRPPFNSWAIKKFFCQQQFIKILPWANINGDVANFFNITAAKKRSKKLYYRTSNYLIVMSSVLWFISVVDIFYTLIQHRLRADQINKWFLLVCMRSDIALMTIRLFIFSGWVTQMPSIFSLNLFSRKCMTM